MSTDPEAAGEFAAITVGVDSYIGLEQANQIAASRLFARAWNAADPSTRCNALRTATALLDRMRWQGRPVTASQPLSWPRVPDRCPHGFPMAAPIPAAITAACVELAVHLLNAGQLPAAPVQMRQLGDALTMYFPTVADELPKHVRRLVEPHLRIASANVAEVSL